MNAEAEIYALCCPDTGDIRYIGKAKDSQKRLKGHLRDAKARRTPVYDWIQSLAKRGAIPALRVLASAFDWRACEKQLIAQYRADGVRLLNLADGGDEPYCSPAHRKEHGRRLQAHPNTIAQRKANAFKANEVRANDAFAYAVHSMMREAGQLKKYMRQQGHEDRATRMTETMGRLRAMDKDWLAAKLSLNERNWHHFPEWFRPLLPGLQQDVRRCLSSTD